MKANADEAITLAERLHADALSGVFITSHQFWRTSADETLVSQARIMLQTDKQKWR